MTARSTKCGKPAGKTSMMNNNRRRAIAALVAKQEYVAQAQGPDEQEAREQFFEMVERFKAERPEVFADSARRDDLFEQDAKAVQAGDITSPIDRWHAIADLQTAHVDQEAQLLARPFETGDERSGELAMRFIRTGSIAEQVPDGFVDADGFLAPEAEDTANTIADMGRDRAGAMIARSLSGNEAED